VQVKSLHLPSCRPPNVSATRRAKNLWKAVRVAHLSNAAHEVDSKSGPLQPEGSGTQIRPTRQCVCHPPQENNGLRLQATKGKPPERFLRGMSRKNTPPRLGALREHHPAPTEISSVPSASVPRFASRANEVPLTGSKSCSRRVTRKIHHAGKKDDPRAAAILQERDLAMTLRWHSAYRLIEVVSLPDERERAGPVPPRCNPQGHLSDSSYQTMEGRRKK
jgi:hypothetical protein